MKTIELTRGKVAIVDNEDFDELRRHKWSALKTGRTWYAVRQSPAGFLYMHGVVAGTPSGSKTDHVDGDGLNNQRANLRVCTSAQNSCNQTRKRADCSSRYRGVTRRPDGKWMAQIKGDGVYAYLGLFESEHDAAGAYDVAGMARDPNYFTPNFSASWLAP